MKKLFALIWRWMETYLGFVVTTHMKVKMFFSVHYFIALLRIESTGKVSYNSINNQINI